MILAPFSVQHLQHLVYNGDDLTKDGWFLGWETHSRDNDTLLDCSLILCAWRPFSRQFIGIANWNYLLYDNPGGWIYNMLARGVEKGAVPSEMKR